MSNDAKTLSVAAAFATAMLATSANANVPAPVVQTSSSLAKEVQPSQAALERLEEAAKTAFFWWPWPPKFVELWPEVTHVETIHTA